MTKDMAEKKHPNHWGGAFAAFGKVFEQIKANPAPALLFVGVYLIASVLEPSSATGDAPMEIGDILLFSGLQILVSLAFLLALPTYALALADRKKIGLGDFMRFNARKYFSVFGVSILYMLIVTGSLLLLIVPAVWTIAWFAACALVVVDQGKSPIKALKESKRLLLNQKGKVWAIIGVTILFSIGASLLAYFPLSGKWIESAGSSLVTLLSTAAMAILYRWVQSQPAEETE